MWPAFWMLGADIGSAGWPRCGEIDMMENIGKEPRIVHGTMHGPGYSGGSALTARRPADGARFADDFHVFAVEWAPDSSTLLPRRQALPDVTPADLPLRARWVFDHPFFLLLNVAVGGNWPGNPDATTEFPQTMLVDYVRVYRTPPPGR